MTSTTVGRPALNWRKSSYSGGTGGNCVEVAPVQRTLTAVRDSKSPHHPTLSFSSTAWSSFVVHTKQAVVPPA